MTTIRYRLVFVGVALSLGAVSRHLAAVDFLRGDANSDGVVSLSDAQFIHNYVFRAGSASECIAAMNANDDAKVNIADPIWIINYLFRNGPEMLAPFPEAGPDPNGFFSGPCDSYGNGSSLEDASAEVFVLDAVARGGADSTVSVILGLASSNPAAGYAATLRTSDVLFALPESPERSQDLTGVESACAFSGRSLKEVSTPTGVESEVRIGFLSAVDNGPCAQSPLWIPPGRVPVLELTLCLKAGTPAGEYPLEITFAEIVDAESGRAVWPKLTGGTLTVLADVTTTGNCFRKPPPVSSVAAAYQLVGDGAAPGGEAVVPFRISSSTPVDAYQFAVSFERDVLEATSVEEIWQSSDGSGFAHARYVLANDAAAPFATGQGAVTGCVVFGLSESVTLPASDDVEMLRFHFRVSPDAPGPSTPVRFVETRGDSINAVSSLGKLYTPMSSDALVLINGFVSILPDGSLFLRGDSNQDGRVDLSDAKHTLSHLFLGSDPPHCPDAADANDDGKVDVSDPIATLDWLFLGGSVLPPPSAAQGFDPTVDGLACSAPVR